MNYKISLIMLLSLISFIPNSKPYTQRDLEQLQSLANMGALCDPVMKIMERYIPVPESNSYQQRRAVTTTKDALKKLGSVSLFASHCLAAATESDENLVSLANACLLATIEAKPDIISPWNYQDCKETGLTIAQILAVNLGNNASGTLIKKLIPQKNLRLVRRGLRILARSTLIGGATAGKRFIENNLLSSNLSANYAQLFIEAAVVAAVYECLFETCGELIALNMREPRVIEDLIDQQLN